MKISVFIFKISLKFDPKGQLKIHQLWLTPLPPVLHICVSESGQHWFRKWLVAYSTPSHYPNQCWVIVNWTLKNKLQWNFNQTTKLFIQENASENIICEMAAILSRGRWCKIMAQHQTGDEPLSQPMMVQFTDAYTLFVKLTLKRLGHFFQNVILFSNVVQQKCNIFIWKCSNKLIV